MKRKMKENKRIRAARGVSYVRRRMRKRAYKPKNKHNITGGENQAV
jgi:hypothetical protein